MPRIDPLQLLKCLSVLLTPEGGILSPDEVPRLVNLMTKFSKKLVSKCVYVLILKNTNNDLVDMFMTEGGWTLIQTWLQDAVQSSNWHLVKEILGLLLITPVDVERLKLNILPKLIKSLSRRDDLEDVAELSTQLVKQWLTIVKGSSNISAQQPIIDKLEVVKSEDLKIEQKDILENGTESISTNTFYKKDAKESSDEVDSVKSEKKDSSEKVKHIDEDKKSVSRSSSSSSRSGNRDKERSKDKDRYRDKDKDKRSSKSSSSKSKSSSSSSRDKDRKDRDRDRERDKNKDKNREKDKDRYKSRSKSGSSSSKDKKESSDKKDKDKGAIEIIKTPSIDKLGRIPKKSSATDSKDNKESKESLDMKKKVFSVGIRKDAEERPKTVKIFNSKMRSTGLEEEAKPAPSRPVKKTALSVPLPPVTLKRPSPPRDIKDPIIPPEKKIKIDKIDIPDRPGAIKLIPPKPKRRNG